MTYLITALVILLVVLLFLLSFMLLRATSFSKRQEAVDPIEGMKIDPPVVAEHLANAVRKVTISDADPSRVDVSAFAELHRALEAMYPRVHGALEKQEINRYGLLYTWKGRKAELDPVLLAAHLDVVPVEAAGLSDWTYPPFSGQVADGYVWGRGTLDIKSQVIAVLEAVENLLKEGYRPQRTILLAFGHDEEVGGREGAACIAAMLQERGVKLAAVIDEGGAIMRGLMAGIKGPVATIGVGEKGYLSLELVARGEPGHSSTPPQHTAIGILGAGLARLEANPMPVNMNSVMPMFQHVGGLLPFWKQFLLGNRWLFGGAIRTWLEINSKTNASIRTTQAVTMIAGGVKDNLLPHEARAVVNFRLLPGDTIAGVCEHVKKALDDERIAFHPLEGAGVREASPVSSTDSEMYRSLAKVIGQIFPGTAVTPYLVLGATDARYYAPLSENVYRFSPMLIDAKEMDRVHGTDERIPVEALGQMVQFFGQLVKVWGE